MKIKESAEKAVILVKVTAPKKVAAERPTTAPGKIQSPTRSTENDAKAKRPKSGAATKKPASKKISSTSSATNLGKTYRNFLCAFAFFVEVNNFFFYFVRFKENFT